MIRLVVSLGLVVLLSLVWEVQGQPKVSRIGLLSVGTDPARPLPPQWIALFEGLRRLGYVDGQSIDRRFAAGQPERMPGFAAELVERKVDVIVVTGMREVQAAHRATTTIPIVTVVAPDLVASGLIVPSDGLTNLHRRQVIDLAAKYRLPALYTLREFVGKPAGIPVEQPAKFDLLVNLKTPRVLGLALPQSLPARADEVIQ